MEEPSALGGASYCYEGVDCLFNSCLVRLLDVLCALCSLVEAVTDAVAEAVSKVVTKTDPKA